MHARTWAHTLKHKHTPSHTLTHSCTHTPHPHLHPHLHPHPHPHPHPHSHPRPRTRPHTQIIHKQYTLGAYAVEADAAAARDVVAKVLGHPLNFKKPRRITGQGSKSADQRVVDAVKAANAFVLGSSMTFVCVGKQVTETLTKTMPQ